MTQPPNSDNRSEPTSNQRVRLLLFSRVGCALGIPLLLGLAAGAWWVWNFINQQLAPLVEKNLAQTLKRPVQLGRVERFSLTGLRFGASSVPATSADPDRAAVDAVDVAFDPLLLVFNRTLKLDITLVNPDAYVEQDKQGRWISTTLAAQEGAGPIKTELDTIQFRNAKVVLVPQKKGQRSSGKSERRFPPIRTFQERDKGAGGEVAARSVPVEVTRINGAAQFLENNQLVSYEVGGQPVTGGNFQLQGETRLKTLNTNLNVQGQNILGSVVTRIVELPLEIQGGRVNGNLKVDWKPELLPPQSVSLFGSADLKGVTAQIDRLPQAFNNSQGTLSFKGTQVGLNNVSTSYGKIPLVANGNLDLAGDYNIKARVAEVSLAAAQSTLSIKSPVPVKGQLQADVGVTGPLLKPTLSGAVATTQPAQIDKVNFTKIRSRFTFSTAASRISLKDIQATPTVGGQIAGAGSITLEPPLLTLEPGETVTGRLNFNFVSSKVPGDALARIYGVSSPQIKIGNIAATAKVSGTSTNPQTLVSWQAPQATYPGSGQVIVRPNTVLLRNTVLNVADGTVRADGQLTGNRFLASVQADGVQLERLSGNTALKGPLSGKFNLAGTTGAVETTRRDASTLRATGSGRINVAGGTVTATNIQVAQGRWQAQIQANGIQPRRVLQQVPPQVQGPVTGTFNLSGITASVQPETIKGSGQARLSNVGGGTVTADNIQLANGQWQALVNASQVQLNRFSQQLRGQFKGQLKVAGNVNSVNLSAIRAAGQVGFSQGLALLNEPLTAEVKWDGEKVILQRATAPNVTASGLIFARVEGAGAPEITGLNLNVKAQNYNLQNIALQLPNAGVKLRGRADFNGRVSGTLTTPNVVGSLRLLDLAVNDIAFERLLTGNVQVAKSGVDFQVTGKRDRIALNLDPKYRPISFFVRRDEAVAKGQAQGENLLVNVASFPLQLLNLTPPNPAFGPGPIAGLLSGNFTVNPTKFTAVGDLAIAEPSIGALKGDQFVAQFRYGNNMGTLMSSEFVQGVSRYALSGSFAQTPKGPEFQGKVNITSGKIQNILAALQYYDFQDFSRGVQPPIYGAAANLNTTSAGIPNAPLLTQIRRFSEIDTLVQQQKQQQDVASPLPALADLRGTFGGEIFVKSSPQSGVAANFDLKGQNWQWGSYNANQLIAQGSFENGILTLLPLRIESLDALLAFTGQIGSKQQFGQLRVSNFPLELVNKFVKLPVEFTGQLNGTATLAGNQENPQAVGELSLNKGTVNQKAIQSALGTFSYANARLNFSSKVLISETQPLEITGSLPYQLPFAKVKPDSDEINLTANVQDEGLGLLNLLTDQVAWQGGQGQVQVQVRGTTQKPIAIGIATVKNATISAAALPEPLTGVTGTAQFNFDRIQVVGVQGNFSRGQVAAKGVIPIFTNLESNDPDINNPLTVTLDKLSVNLKNLYQGGVNGNVVLTGSAFNPIIGGEVLLSQGEVLLPSTEEPALGTQGQGVRSQESGVSSPSVPPGEPGGASLRRAVPSSELAFKSQESGDKPSSNSSPAIPGSAAGIVPEFNDLRLTLGDDISIISPPILNIKAKGTLAVNGALNDLRPDGTVRLVGGGINLFTTQFVLARGYEQTATFDPKQGLDPTLDVRFTASVPEVTQTQVPSSPLSGEVNDQPSTRDVGTLQTVRVTAAVQGPASQLSQNLELTSEPSRTQSEIVALIGGSFVDTLGRGGSLGLANLASSAFLGNFQGNITNIGNSLGLSELRIFPTISNETEAKASRNSSALGLAAEAGVNISRNLYFSVLGYLTPSQPTQFGLSYRLNPQVRVRTSSDFSGESRAVVEYENRF